MIKGYSKENFLFFYVNGSVKLNKEVEPQMILLKQICNQYGKVIIVGPMMALKVHEDLRGREKQVMITIVDEFQMLWQEYEEIQKKIDSSISEKVENISGS
ncbi:hypothetical protein V4D30_01060 [Thermodesulfovibrio sp. 3907-1M]|uniref:Uncharacterized protein n=1 Tax=Thermodesulfovibrio autotrophicus TaxID=3118333 RepID=A0AAU8GW86_9BACT